MPDTEYLPDGLRLPTWLLLLNNRKRTAEYIENLWVKQRFEHLCDFVITRTIANCAGAGQISRREKLLHGSLPENTQMLNLLGLHDDHDYRLIPWPHNTVLDINRVVGYHLSHAEYSTVRFAYSAYCKVYQGLDGCVNRKAGRVISHVIYTVKTGNHGIPWHTYSRLVATEAGCAHQVVYEKEL